MRPYRFDDLLARNDLPGLGREVSEHVHHARLEAALDAIAYYRVPLW
ncbi:MAG: hypothetical protein AAFX10_12315 [Pseudomonadota bacterium]